MSKQGFIGLGIMGTPMALRLRAAGHELFVYTRGEPGPEVIAAGAVRARPADCPAHACIRSMSPSLVAASRMAAVRARCTG